MYDFMDDNPISAWRRSSTRTIRTSSPESSDGVINSALEVDLQGQIVADHRGPPVLGRRRSYGFHEGTSLSLEHVSLICLQSTATVDGVLKSRIIGDMTPHSTVTSPRHLAGVIVTNTDRRPARTDGERTPPPHGDRPSAVPRRTLCSG